MLRNAVLTPTNSPFREPVPRGAYAGLDFDFRRRRFRVGGRLVAYDQAISLSAPSPKYVWTSEGELFDSPAGQPAWDYDPLTGESRGQLLEAMEATNLLPNSDTFSNWYSFRSTLSESQTMAPDLSETTTAVDYTGENARPGVQVVVGHSGGPVTFSVYVLPDQMRYFQILFNNSGLMFDLIEGVVVNDPHSFFVSAEACPLGFWRIAISSDIAGPNVTAKCAFMDTTESNSPDDVTPRRSGYLWRAMLEVGTNPSSAIKTNASAVTRAADVMNADALFAKQYNPELGWLFIDYDSFNDSGIVLSAQADIESGHTANSIQIGSNLIRVLGNEFYQTGIGAGRRKILIRWCNGKIYIFKNGELIVTWESAMPDGINTLYFFRMKNTDVYSCNGRLFRFRMGDTISDAGAIARTTL